MVNVVIAVLCFGLMAIVMCCTDMLASRIEGTDASMQVLLIWAAGILVTCGLLYLAVEVLGVGV